MVINELRFSFNNVKLISKIDYVKTSSIKIAGNDAFVPLSVLLQEIYLGQWIQGKRQQTNKQQEAGGKHDFKVVNDN